MGDNALLSVFAIHALIVVTPGPNFLLVAHRAVAASRRQALSAAMGVALAAVIWATIATVVFAAAANAMGHLFEFLRLAGGAYLLWLAVGLWRSSASAAGEVSGLGPSARHALIRGFLTNLLNPKSAVFFGSVLSAALPADASLATRMAVVAIVGVNATLWYSAVALALSSGPPRRQYLRAQSTIDRLAGLAMGVFAVRLILQRAN